MKVIMYIIIKGTVIACFFFPFLTNLKGNSIK